MHIEVYSSQQYTGGNSYREWEMGWRFAGTSWVFRPTTIDTKTAQIYFVGWVGRPQAVQGRAARPPGEPFGACEALPILFVRTMIVYINIAIIKRSSSKVK